MTDNDFYKDMKAKPLLDRLEWAAFKMCQRGHHEDFASDVMTEAKARIERLEKALRKICDGPRDADKSYAELFAEVCWEARAALSMEENDE